MDLIYSYDPERFELGTLCKRGHCWPGTQQSLRSIYIDQNGRKVNNCVACKSPRDWWLLPFVDCEAMGMPAGSRLGKLCKAGHRWNGLDASIKDRFNKCPDCERARKSSKEAIAVNKQWREKNREIISQKSKDKYLAIKEDPCELKKLRQRHRAAVARMRAKNGRPSRGKHSTGEVLPVFPGLKGIHARKARQLVSQGHSPEKARILVFELESLWNAIKAIKPVTVAELVRQEQRRYWDENPKAEADAKREAKRIYSRWKFLTDPEYRLYHRQKSKQRKAQMRNSVALQVSAKQIRARFAQFDHRCAYCGAIGEDLHIEHVVPISKGGPHALGNIIPACRSCNFSKFDNDVEEWYRAQDFYSELRWRKICRVLGWHKSAVGQLALL